MHTLLSTSAKSFMVLVAVALTFCSCTVNTKPYAEKEWAEKGITSLETIEAGGIQHAVLIRGTDRNNPLLIYLHGFAVPMMPFAHLSYPGPEELMEQRFVVVNYDQRGTGKTARISGKDTGPFTIDQYVKDAEELIETLMKRFGQQKVYLSGISWGSVIGMKLVQKHPEWFHAYIAEGQAVNIPETYREVRRFVTAEASADRNDKALAELSAVADPGLGQTAEAAITSTQVIIKWADFYTQKKYHLLDLEKLFISSLWAAPEYNLFDFITTVRSIDSFTRHNTLPLLAVDLRNEVPEVRVPVYMITGEYDLMKIAGKQYFDRLKAPGKTWFDLQKAGHAVSADQPAQVQSIYIDRMLKETYIK